MLKRFLLVSLVLICAVSLVATGTAFGAQKYKRKFLKMVTGPPGGSYYPLGAGMMKLMEKNTGISCASGIGAGSENIVTVQAGRADVGWSYGHSTYNGYNGLAEFKKLGNGKPNKDIRYLASLYPGVYQSVVPKKSKIKSYADLWNKNVAPGKIGASQLRVSEMIFKAYGFSFESIIKNGGSVSYVGHADRAALLKDGNADMYCLFTNMPHSSIIDLNFRPGIRVLGLDPPHLKKVLEIMPGMDKVIMPAGTYKGMEEEKVTVGTVAAIFGHKDIEDEVAYAMVKTVFENLGELAKIKPAAIKYVQLENALRGCKIPVHPGAMKYYKEHGVKIK